MTTAAHATSALDRGLDRLLDGLTPEGTFGNKTLAVAAFLVAWGALVALGLAGVL